MRRSIDRRAIKPGTDRRECLIQLVARQLTQAKLRGTAGEKVARFTSTLLVLWSADGVTPGQIRQYRLSGLFEDKAIRVELEEAWAKSEEARTMVPGALAGGFAFRALRKAYIKQGGHVGSRGQVPGGVRR